MSEPSLPELEAERERLYAQLSEVGDFRRGSVSENYRKCGKPNCACAQPGHPGHGPRFLWTRTVRGQRTRGRQLVASEMVKVRGELAAYQEFASLAERIVEVDEAICEARLPTRVTAGPPRGLRERAPGRVHLLPGQGHRRPRSAPRPPSPLPDKLYAVIDGTGVPMTSKEAAGPQGAKARTGAPAPARTGSPSSSPRTS